MTRCDGGADGTDRAVADTAASPAPTIDPSL
jgi:hypothetical protein